MIHGAELRVHFLKSFQKGSTCENLSQKGLKSKKDGGWECIAGGLLIGGIGGASRTALNASSVPTLLRAPIIYSAAAPSPSKCGNTSAPSLEW
jgi:hypothetical protein